MGAGRPAEAKVSAVYFLADGYGPEARVKVGRTVDTERRLRELQTGNASSLRYLGWVPGGAEAEMRLHAALSEHHVSGEWYELTPEVRTLIEGACACHRMHLDYCEEKDLTAALEATHALVCGCDVRSVCRCDLTCHDMRVMWRAARRHGDQGLHVAVFTIDAVELG